MKIICIGRNYAAHALELGNDLPQKPLIFMKPSSAITVNARPFYYPDFSNNIHFECEVVLKICENGKSIAPKFASNYYQEVTLGIDFTARDLQDELKALGQPWELAKAFDGSAALGKFIPKAEAFNAQNHIEFEFTKNEQLVQKGNTQNLIFSFDTLIAYTSKFFKLNKGDLIFTGTPEGVGPIAIGDHYQGFINGQRLLEIDIK